MNQAGRNQNPYDARFAGIYDCLYPKDDSADQVADVLAGLAGAHGSALELGIGTGRIAIPLARRIRSVVGVDSSPHMLTVLQEEIRRHELNIKVVEADLCDYREERTYALVYCVCATLGMIVDNERQREAIQAAADHLAPGGHLVIEALNLPGIRKMMTDGKRGMFFTPYPEPDSGVLSSWVLDPKTSLWQVSHIWFADGGFKILSEVSNPSTPEEIDKYAMDAGLRPLHRYGDWVGTPYSDDDRKFIAVYRKTGG